MRNVKTEHPHFAKKSIMLKQYMKIQKIEYNKVPAISFKDLSYIELAPYLKKFYSYTPEIESFSKAIEDRKMKPVNRKLLVEVLTDQYSKINPSSKQNNNIEALRSEDAFTVITAHQPSLLGGPLYYILKVCSVINLCNQLKEKFPAQEFIPTFISGGEDHDFEEIDHLHLYGKTVKWERPAKGPVGRLDLTHLDQTIDEVKNILGDHPIAKKLGQLFDAAINSSDTYGDFVFRFVNSLFGDYGLIAINMDDKRFKNAFAPSMKKELLEQTSIQYVKSTQEDLISHNFKAQAFPRDINLFYLGEGSRDRIELIEDVYKIIGSELQFTKDKILAELEKHPENFSPNVVMRPLYQESILPNLAYLGGGGEIAYWLERKSQFEAFDVFYPMLIRRNSVMIMNAGLNKTMDKLGFELEDVLQTEDELINQFIRSNTEVEINLSKQKEQIKEAFEVIASKSQAIDPGLAKSVLADMTKQLKNIDQMESRIKRAIKSKQEVNIKKISKLKDKLFPNNGLQERYDNFMPHYLAIGDSFFDLLIENLDPMDKRFTIVG